MNGLGARIAAARRNADLNQTTLARRLGVTQTAVSYWERDRREPSLEDLIALARELGVTLAHLAGTDTSEPESYWVGWRAGWLACSNSVRAASTLQPDLMPPRADRSVPDDLIEAQLRHLRYGAPPPDLSGLPPAEREHEEGLLRLVTALADRYPQTPPLEQDPVARRLGLVGDRDGEPK